ncbi:MAG: DUF418 domain-containing protein [Nitriliruptorales bacterium]|nr:DUF418 domain-containing protein [Nitriliruptorales bacterium]
MVSVHVGPTGAEGAAGRLYAAPHGRASILFAVVAGVGVSLLARSGTASLSVARRKLLWRAFVLLPIGLTLQLLDHGASVILQNYAVLFVLAIGVLGLDDRWLLALAGAAAAFGPLGYLWGTIAAPHAFTREAVALTDSLGEILRGLVLSGPYPLITWAAPFLFGIWLGRRDLGSSRVRAGLLLAGGTVAAVAIVTSLVLVAWIGRPVEPVGWDQLIVQSPHSQMPLWLIGATGSAAFVLGGSLVLADAAVRLTWPLVAVGQLALTIYVAHLLALHAWPATLTSERVSGAVVLVSGFTLGAALLATIWRALFRRGPLEVVLGGPWQWEPRRRPSVTARWSRS